MNKKNTFFGALLVYGKNLPVEKHSTLGRHIRVLECTFLCIEFTLFNKKGCSSKNILFHCYIRILLVLFAQQIVDSFYRIEGFDGHFYKNGIPVAHGSVTQTRQFEGFKFFPAF